MPYNHVLYQRPSAHASRIALVTCRDQHDLLTHPLLLLTIIVEPCIAANRTMSWVPAIHQPGSDSSLQKQLYLPQFLTTPIDVTTFPETCVAPRVAQRGIEVGSHKLVQATMLPSTQYASHRWHLVCTVVHLSYPIWSNLATQHNLQHNESSYNLSIRTMPIYCALKCVATGNARAMRDTVAKITWAAKDLLTLLLFMSCRACATLMQRQGSTWHPLSPRELQ